MLRKIFAIASSAGSVAAAGAYALYRKDISAARSAIEKGSMVASTTKGPIEFAEMGKGKPMLLIHGAGGGYDQGLLIGRDIGNGYRIIAPSRFGYLRTPVPEDSSPAAQADAHAALLDHLGLGECIVVGVSAGGPSAIELALRYPERVSALILLVPRTYDPTQAIGVDNAFQSQMVLRLVERSADFLFWLAMRLARAAVVRFLGVPPALEAKASEEERARVTEVMRTILPLSQRVRGIEVDSEAEISPWPLERISMPTLIVSARDDLYNTLPGARFTAQHIPNARLEVLESGGHLMMGQGMRVREWIRELLEARPEQKRQSSEANEESVKPEVFA